MFSKILDFRCFVPNDTIMFFLTTTVMTLAFIDEKIRVEAKLSGIKNKKLNW